MKTAYELAMERMERDSGATKKLSDAQRAAIADIEKKYASKIAETKLRLDTQIAACTTIDEFNALRESNAEELARLDALREKEKEAVWNEA